MREWGGVGEWGVVVWLEFKIFESRCVNATLYHHIKKGPDSQPHTEKGIHTDLFLYIYIYRKTKREAQTDRHPYRLLKQKEEKTPSPILFCKKNTRKCLYLIRQAMKSVQNILRLRSNGLFKQFKFWDIWINH